MRFLWETLFHTPLYNALIYLIDVIPWHDVGLAVVILTLTVKFILMPLSKKSILSQIKIKKLEPELKKLKEEYKDKKEEQARKTLELYRQNKINPFSGFLLILVQLPVIFALYFVFLNGLDFGKTDLLYSFIKAPEVANFNFLGLIDIQGKSIVLALLAGITQFIQTRMSLSASMAPDKADKSFKAELMKSMNIQMKYILPVFIAFVAYQISAAVALYWVTSNIFTIGQEYFVIRKLREKHA